MPNSASRIAFYCALVAVTAACGSGSRSSRPAPGPQPSVRPQPTIVINSPRGDDRSLGVPPGHIPAPGSCRLWYPGRPPGQQPRAGECGSIMRDAPAGAWVLYRPQHEPRYVHRREIHARRPGVVAAINVFEVKRGIFVRDEHPGASDERSGQGSASRGSPPAAKGQDGPKQDSSNGKTTGKPDAPGKSGEAGKPDAPGKSGEAGKPDAPGKAGEAGKPDAPGKSAEAAGKPDTPGKSGAAGKPDEQAEPDARGKSDDKGKSRSAEAGKSQDKGNQKEQEKGKEQKAKSPER